MIVFKKSYRQSSDYQSLTFRQNKDICSDNLPDLAFPDPLLPVLVRAMVGPAEGVARQDRRGVCVVSLGEAGVLVLSAIAGTNRDSRVW